MMKIKQLSDLFASGGGGDGDCDDHDHDDDDYNNK